VYARAILASAATPLTGVDQVALGHTHACALSQGKVWCWGWSSLGDGTGSGSFYPVRAGVLTAVTKVAAGWDTTCALIGSGAEKGAVYCWGDNGTSGGLGVGNQQVVGASKLAPTRVRLSDAAYLTNAIDIVVTSGGGCALNEDHSLWCWGTAYAPSPTSDYASVWNPGPGNISVSDVVAFTPTRVELRYLRANGDYVNGGLTAAPVAVGCGLLD
jgi:serine/threonine-protein kinase